MSGIKKTVRDVIAQAVPELPPGDLMIEFALPDALLNTAVETWDLGDPDRPIGVGHAVVVRSTDRDTFAQYEWQSRHARLRVSPTSGLVSATEWVDCREPRNLKSLYAALEANHHWHLVALTGWLRGAPVPVAMRAALGAGLSAIVWRHERCPEHRASHANAVGMCSGDRFRVRLAKRLVGADVSGLPELVRRLRAEALGQSPVDRDHHGHGLALLWDDSDRVPWAMAFRHHEPA
jgi:hypothetical protein